MSLLQEAEPMRVRAALSRDGVEVYGEISCSLSLSLSSSHYIMIMTQMLIDNFSGNSVNMQPMETRPILLQVR